MRVLENLLKLKIIGTALFLRPWSPKNAQLGRPYKVMLQSTSLGRTSAMVRGLSTLIARLVLIIRIM